MGGGERVLLGILGGGVPPGSPNPDPISDKKCHFLHPFSDQTSYIHSHHTHFQTWPLGRSYAIITERANKQIYEFYFVFAYFSFFLTHLVLER